MRWCHFLRNKVLQLSSNLLSIRCSYISSHVGIEIILYYSRSISTHQTQIQLDIGIPLFGSKLQALHCSLNVFCNTLTVTVHFAQIELGTGKSLLGGKFAPLQRSLIVL